MKAYYQIEVRDKEGKLLKRFRRRSRSYVRQWNDLIYGNAYAGGTSTATDYLGTSRTLRAADPGLRMDAAEAIGTYGVKVGSGTTAVSISDYCLATVIDHGTGSGQLYHYVVSLTTPSVVGSVCSFTVTRVFGNQSGATITVKEIGIYAMATDSGAVNRMFCVIRDVLASVVDIPNGGAITVVYTIKVTV